MKLLLKARILLLLALAMQVSVLFKGLHHHEEVCLLAEDGSRTEQQVLHAHSNEHTECAWDAFHFSSVALVLPEAYRFVAGQLSFIWSPLAPGNVTLPAQQASGRAPPAV